MSLIVQKFGGTSVGTIERIEQVAAARQRRYLETLWGFLRRFAVDPEIENLPSRRKLAAELNIPRERLSSLYDKLQEFIRRCQATLSGAVVQLRRKNPSGDQHV